MTLDTFNEVLLGGVVLGSLYALMATGLALVWTTLGIFNFAHGTFIALGAYIAWQIASSEATGAGLLVGALTSIVGMFVIGVMVYYLLIKPFERSPDIVVKSVITTLAGATILENSINLVWGPRNKQLDPFLSGDISFSGLVVSRNEAAIVVISLIILAGLGLFLQRAPLADNADPVAHVRHHRRVGGEDAVGGETAHIRIIRGRDKAGAAAFADSEKAHAAWVRVRPAFQVGQRRPNIPHFIVGYPLQRLITRLRLAFTLAARFKCEHVEAVLDQVVAVFLACPAIRAKLEAE